MKRPNHGTRPRVTPRRKYGNRKVTRDGIQFDSLKEATRYEQLKHEQMAGAISGLELQKRIKLFAGQTPLKYATGRSAFYVADFFYFDEQKRVWVIEDSKGFPTPEYKLKRAIVEAMIHERGPFPDEHFMGPIIAEIDLPNHWIYIESCCIFKET